MPRRNINILLSVAFACSLCYLKADAARRSEHHRMFETFSRVMTEIDENFVEEVDADRRRMLFEAGLAGVVNALGDKNSRYIPPREYVHVREELDQKMTGIGIRVRMDPETRRPIVFTPLFGSPAFEAGIRAGDVIMKVDGHDTEGETLNDAVRRIKGEEGVPVRLTVLHQGQAEPVEIKVIRATMHVPTVLGDLRKRNGEWEFMLEHAPGLAYIRVEGFGSDTVDEVESAIDDAVDRGMRALVLDLRGNPGGLLRSAVEVCDLFLEEGLIVRTVGRGGVTKREFAEAGGYTDFPIAVLIDGNSASASEIVAACLQHYGRAVVVGDRSYGKGSVQDIIRLENDTSGLKLTIARYYPPGGRNIDRGIATDDEWGVLPDAGHEVKLDAEALKRMVEHRDARSVYDPDGDAPPYEIGADPQFDKAVEALNEKLGRAAQDKAA